jgi:REase_AHJR-like
MEAATSRERQRARAIAEAYRSRGYEVIEQPSPEQLPEFLAGYRPDLLVRRGDESTIVMVRSRSSLAKEPQITELARLLPRKPHWNFELAMVGEGEQLSTPEGARPFARDDVLRGIEDAERLVVAGFSEAALLWAWSISEATVRLLTEDEGIVLDRYSPLYILKQAVINGVISRDDYNFLTKVMKYRNAFVHGFKTLDFDPALVTKLINLTKRLLQSTSTASST